MKYTAFYLTHRYFVCHPESVAELWEENLMLFRSNPTYQSANSIWEPVPHGFCQQFPYSCRFYPGSPRNRIIQAFFFREESESVIRACVKNIRGENTIVPYVNPKSKKTLDQEIDCDILSEVLKITVSLFMYY